MLNEESSVDPGQLARWGKEASRRYLERGGSLSHAVRDVVENEKLGSEHVKRVVEHANNATFTHMFKLAVPGNKLVSFAGGPASPDTVLGSLRGPPQEAAMMKAARSYERGMDSLDVMLFDDGLEKVASHEVTPDEILRDTLVLEKEAEDLSFELGVLASRYTRSTNELCKVARDLLRSGASTADLSQAVTEYMPRQELAKLALKHLSQNLSDLPATGVSKTAGLRVLREGHPFCQVLEKFAGAALDYYAAAADADRLRGILVEAKALAKEALRCSTR